MNVGDELPAKRINDLGKVSGRFARSTSGSNIAGKQGGSFFAVAAFPPWTQAVVEITDDTIDDTDAADSGLFLCKLRYFHPTDDEWKSQEKEWRLDSTAIGVELFVGDLVVAFWSQQRGMFIPIASLGGTGKRWAVVDYDGGEGTDYEENAGDPRVSVTRCNRDGTGAAGDSFYVYTPRLRGQAEDMDPSVYYGDVLSYELDVEGTPICTSNYMWCAIGDLKYRKTDRIPMGWREVVGEGGTEWDARGRVLMARDEDGRDDENEAGDEGGYRWHGLTENNHSDHIMENVQVDDEGLGELQEVHASRDWPAETDNYEHDGPFNGGYDTDNRMRYKVAILIERYK